MFCIINWSCPEDISVCLEEDGTPTLFETYEEAELYAKNELNFHWRIIDLEN
jgi:hypothetical protein